MLWQGLPGSGKGQGLSFTNARRTLWAALGLLVLYAGVRAWRGIDLAEAYTLARFGIALFLFGVAMPEVVNLLTRNDLERRGEVPEKADGVLVYLVGMLGTGLVLAALLTQSDTLAKIGAMVWMATLAWVGRMMIRQHLIRKE